MAEPTRYKKKAPGSLALPVNIPDSNEKAIFNQGMHQVVQGLIQGYGVYTKAQNAKKAVRPRDVNNVTENFERYAGTLDPKEYNDGAKIQKVVDQFVKDTKEGNNPTLKYWDATWDQPTVRNQLNGVLVKRYSQVFAERASSVVSKTDEEFDLFTDRKSSLDDFVKAQASVSTGNIISKDSGRILGISEEGFEKIATASTLKSFSNKAIEMRSFGDKLSALKFEQAIKSYVAKGSISKEQGEATLKDFYTGMRNLKDRHQVAIDLSDVELTSKIRDDLSRQTGIDPRYPERSQINISRERENRINRESSDTASRAMDVLRKKGKRAFDDFIISQRKKGSLNSRDYDRLNKEAEISASEYNDAFKQFDSEYKNHPFSNVLSNLDAPLAASYFDKRDEVASAMVRYKYADNNEQAFELLKSRAGVPMTILSYVQDEAGITDREMAGTVTKDEKLIPNIMTKLNSAHIKLEKQSNDLLGKEPTRALIIERKVDAIAALKEYYKSFDASVPSKAENVQGDKPTPGLFETGLKKVNDTIKSLMRVKKEIKN